MKGVLAGPATRVEYRADEATFGRQLHNRRLRLPNVPRSGAVAVRRIPGLTGPSLMTGRAPGAGRIGSGGSWGHRSRRLIVAWLGVGDDPVASQVEYYVVAWL